MKNFHKFVIFSEWKIEKIKIALDKRDAALKENPKRKAYIKKLEERKKAMEDEEKRLIQRKVRIQIFIPKFFTFFG